MKITNNAKIAPVIERAAIELQRLRLEMRAAEAKKHAPKPTFSVTELLKPIYQTELCRRYNETITVEAEDLLWAIEGSANHNVLEILGKGETALTEVALAWVGPHGVLTGRIDTLEAREDGKFWLQDIKTAKCWAVVIREMGDKDSDQLTEWKRQVRLYHFLARQNGLEIYRSTIEALWKDWSESKINSDPYYPHNYWSRIEVDPMPDATIVKWINARMQTLLAARKVAVEHLNPCTPKERWERNECWAVQKSDAEGRPTGKARKLFRIPNHENAEAAAQEYLKNCQGHDAVTYGIHHRLPDRIRCRKYCVARRVCPDYGKFLEALERRDAEA